MRVGVNVERAEAFGKALSGTLKRVVPDPFTDPRYYPGEQESREKITAYFLVMVALDHRLSRPGRPYEGIVDGKFYHGADLLYRLGKKIFDEDPEFFTARRLAAVKVDDIRNLFSAEKSDGRKITPPDPEVRAALLRDLGLKLGKLYGGSAYRIVVESRGYLRYNVGEGFIDRVKIFTAYQDPVEKKPFLLAKFLERRKILPVWDGWNKEVPVDNHLTRIAIRTGIVDVDTEVLEKIAAGIEFSPEEDIILRYNARLAYRIAAQAGGIDPFIMDDLLWQFGRYCCTRDAPVCKSNCTPGCRRLGGCSSDGKCIMTGVCLADKNPLYMVNEHNFLNTWWY